MSCLSRLHRAIWRNDFEQIRELVKQLEDINTVDEESGWSILHRAFYFGHIRCAMYLIRKGAALTVLDRQGRSPLELLSKESHHPLGKRVAKSEVFSWGSGANYQLGTGKTALNQPARRLETLRNQSIVVIAAGKYHNLALEKSGKVYSWGWGRGGRLGLPEPQLHSNDGAQILPRIIPSLIDKRIVSIAVAKHHSIAVSSTGEVYSWGLNRDGRLGYTTVNKQVTPKRIHTLKGVQCVSAAAANKHSAILTAQGAVYTWGSNVYGQLGYGTSDSISNPTPRRVESLQHKSLSQISLSKHHTLALTNEGEVYSWGNKSVAPKKMSWSGIKDQETVNARGAQIQFHRGWMKVKKPLAVGIAAGVHQSACLTTTGCVLCWDSNNPSAETMMEVAGCLAGKKAVSISSGKSSMAVSVSTGEVYSWDCQSFSAIHKRAIEAKKVDGLRNVVSVQIGKKHGLVLQEWNTGQELHPTSSQPGSLISTFSSHTSTNSTTFVSSLSDQDDSKLAETSFSCLAKSNIQKKSTKSKQKLESLQLICEEIVAQHVLNPTTALCLFEYADTIGATNLKARSLHLIVLNLALVLHESVDVLITLPECLLLEIEEAYQKEVLKLTETTEEEWWLKGWIPNKHTDITCRRPTYKVCLEKSEGSSVLLGNFSDMEIPNVKSKMNRFMPKRESLVKIRRTMVKKLEQIEVLFQKEASGVVLDQWQKLKISKQSMYKKTLDAIDHGKSYEMIQKMLSESSQAHNKVEKERVPNPETSGKKKEKSKLDPKQHSWEEIKLKEKTTEQLPRFLEPKKENSKTHDLCNPEEWIPVHSHKEKKLSKSTTAQKQIPSNKPPIPSTKAEDCCTTHRKKLSLGDFIVPQQQKAQPMPQQSLVPKAKDPGPAWGGASLRNSAFSFQSIQEEQKNNKPGCPLPGNATKPAVERLKTVNRWHVPCDIQTQSIDCIQVEEKAVQELRQLYKGAKVRVKIGTAREQTKKTGL